MATDKPSPFDYINVINKKENTDIDPQFYEPFMVNRGLSYFKDTVLWSNEMNRRWSSLDKDMQFRFLLNTVRKGNRFSKWYKADKSEELSSVMEYYNVNRQRAQEYLSILTPSQLEVINDKLRKGGRNNGLRGIKDS